MTGMPELPRAALRLIEVLEGAGGEAWVVGGWVRDALRGAPDHDVDVCCSLRWQQTKAACEAAGIAVHETGTAHGTVTCVSDGMSIEVTTFRVEGTYSDMRHPDSVAFVEDVREDLARRDLTINAMAYHPCRGLLDPYGGQDDLAAGVIRCVGDPATRFGEDALRVLRAVRFACRLGFVVEPATQAALDAAAPTLSAIAPERIGAELDGILASGRLSWAMLHERPAMAAAVPELAALVGFGQRSVYHIYDVYEHTAQVAGALEAFSGGCAPSCLRWAALLHDVGKPSCFTVDDEGRGHFYGHPAKGARMAEAALRRMAVPGEVARPACALVAMHDLPFGPAAPQVRRALARLDRACPGQALPLMHELLLLKRADALGKAPSCFPYVAELDRIEAAVRAERRRGPVVGVRDLAIGGADVMRAAGIGPGREVGRLLAAVLDEVVAGKVGNDPESLMAYVRSLALR
ncbi:MAG: HD domain-containing protein [Atopobiaceae bacterium]|jgi:tRNA nucleotidyltransferase (CCA-adding enzyme)|nr:HD domain-containing protein [Atopobiaceae bacterium]MCH4120454.1 HD domain-containing protein [Atopobiaceae bacterium]MCI1388292.1 HD domain-containing protein [Atopobiaceae bacterium]MCI1431458.1 HD domain-containing protein [Atopobiaceae bacterium]MCI1469894.1 HD domain-containing protein [Atopobiaceae bacterium]